MKVSERKSFILHNDSLEVLSMLTDEQAGKLFKAVRAYVNGEANDEFGEAFGEANGEAFGEAVKQNQLLEIAFLPIKNQLMRDKEAYEKRCASNKVNGSKGGRPKAASKLSDNPNNRAGLVGLKNKPKKGDNDSDSDSDSDNDKDKTVTGLRATRFDEFWKLYPKKKNKGTAERAWEKGKLWNGSFDSVMTGLEDAIHCDDWQQDGGRFIPYPATWLNAKGWEDELTGVAGSSPVDYLAGVKNA